jgi:hypothetical protein
LPTQPPLPYGERVCLDELATQTIFAWLKPKYEERAKRNPLRPVPPDERIRELAASIKERSMQNGSDNYLGSAKAAA